MLVLLGLSLTACAGSPGQEYVGYWHTRPTVGAPPDDESTTRIHRDGDTWLADGFRDPDHCHPVDTYPLTLADNQLRTAPVFGGMVVLSYLRSDDTVLMTAGTMRRVLDRVPDPSC